MRYVRNVHPELDATLPAGEHVGIIVFSPLKIFNRNIGWVCFCAVQVKPAVESILFSIGPFQISLEKTKLIGMVYVVGGQTTFIQNDLLSMLDVRANLWWVV